MHADRRGLEQCAELRRLPADFGLAVAQRPIVQADRRGGPPEQNGQQGDLDQGPRRSPDRRVHQAGVLQPDAQPAERDGGEHDERKRPPHEQPAGALIEGGAHRLAFGRAGDESRTEQQQHRRGLQRDAGQARNRVHLRGAVQVPDQRQHRDRHNDHCEDGAHAAGAEAAIQEHQCGAGEQKCRRGWRPHTHRRRGGGLSPVAFGEQRIETEVDSAEVFAERQSAHGCDR